MKKTIIGVMGPGQGATENDVENAFELGRKIAKKGWVLLTGGMNSGVMDAASRGAKAANGLVVGILPTSKSACASDAVDIPIVTDMGSARNNVNVLSSDVVIACGMGPGTASEIALALKGNKKVVLLNEMEESKIFFQKLSGGDVYIADNPEEAAEIAEEIIGGL